MHIIISVSATSELSRKFVVKRCHRKVIVLHFPRAVDLVGAVVCVQYLHQFLVPVVPVHYKCYYIFYKISPRIYQSATTLRQAI